MHIMYIAISMNRDVCKVRMRLCHMYGAENAQVVEVGELANRLDDGMHVEATC